jgi:hypothetical protein
LPYSHSWLSISKKEILVVPSKLEGFIKDQAKIVAKLQANFD